MADEKVLETEASCCCGGGGYAKDYSGNQERGMNERIRRLRKISTTTQPHIYMERAVLETEVYKKYEGTVSVPELRALVLLKHFFSNKKDQHRRRRADCRREGRRPAVPLPPSRSCAATRCRICTT